VGRGRLRGRTARLTYDHDAWEVRQTEQRLEINGERATFDKWVQAFANEVR